VRQRARCTHLPLAYPASAHHPGHHPGHALNRTDARAVDAHMLQRQHNAPKNILMGATNNSLKVWYREYE
jgi:hypothetical protein